MLKNQAAAVKTFRQAGVLTKILGSFFAGFMLANSTLNGAQSPLAVGLVGALNLSEGIFAFLGGMLAYLITGKIGDAIVEISAMVGILVFRVILCEFIRKEIKAAGAAVLTGISYIAAGLAVVFAMSGSGGAVFLVVCKGLLCGCAAYFAIMSFNAAQSEQKLVISGTSGAALGVVFVIGVAALCSAQVGFFNFGRAFGVLVVLLAAKKFKHAGGAVCGALVTCGVVLYSPDMGKATMLLAAAGMVAGLFAEFGALPAAFFFISANAVGLIAIGVTPETARILVDAMVASVAFVILPERLTSVLLGSSAVSRCNSKINALTASKLTFAAKTIAEVRKSVEQVSKALEKKSGENDISVAVCDQICGKCRNNLYCWESEFDKSFEAFREVKTVLEQKGRVVQEDLPQSLAKCFKRAELTDCFNESHHIETAEKQASRRLREMRGVLYEQFSGMEDMLEEISGEILEANEYDDELSKSVKSFLLDFGAQLPRVCVFLNPFGKIRIEAFYEGELTLEPAELADELSEIVDRELELPQIFTANGYSKLCLIEKTAYTLEVGASQKTGRGEETSGDKYEVFYDGLGNACLILSDGMGSGKMAAIDSRMTSSLLIRLLKAGVGFSAAVKLINSSMLVKSGNESFATLDIVCVNLYNGRVDLLKLGAAATFIKSGNRVTCVEASSLPVGIVQEVQPEKRSTVLKEGDMIVMISDGIEETHYTALRNELLKKDIPAAEVFASTLLEKATARSATARTDDMTILVAGVKVNN